MTTKLAEWASEHVQITKFGLSDGSGGNSHPVVMEFGYYRYEVEGFLGNVG